MTTYHGDTRSLPYSSHDEDDPDEDYSLTVHELHDDAIHDEVLATAVYFFGTFIAFMATFIAFMGTFMTFITFIAGTLAMALGTGFATTFTFALGFGTGFATALGRPTGTGAGGTRTP